MQTGLNFNLLLQRVVILLLSILLIGLLFIKTKSAIFCSLHYCRIIIGSLLNKSV